MNRWGALAILLAVAGALALRLWKLETRPLHNDEAVNAFKVTELWQEGRYRYDPDEYHGPTLHYATVPFLALSAASGPNELRDATLRLAPVCFGAALILLLFLFADGLGRAAVLWCALFIAVSPAMVFYSRYFIHEMLLVFFTALALGAGWRYSRSRAPAWAAISGAAIGLMFATKETFVLACAALAFAVAATAWWSSPGRSPRALTRLIDWRHFGLATAAFGIVWLLFFSSFFTNFAGLLDSIRTYFPWLKRAAGHSPHIHPWHFYFERLAWFHPMKGPVFSEGLTLALALAGAVSAFRRKDALLPKFLVFYTCSLAAIYCAISYKTPWCLLGFYHGMLLLAGVGAAALIQRAGAKGLKVAVGAVILAFSAQLAVQAWRASIPYAADRRNPYVYAQTAQNTLSLVERVEGIGRVSPAGYETVIKIVAPESDYWPLPWYFRRFKHTGWYDTLPDDPFAPVVIVAAGLNAQLDEKSERKWIMAGMTELRPGKFLELYVELELWKKYVETLPPEPEEE